MFELPNGRVFSYLYTEVITLQAINVFTKEYKLVELSHRHSQTCNCGILSLSKVRTALNDCLELGM